MRADLEHNVHADVLVLSWQTSLGFQRVSDSVSLEWDELSPEEWDLLPLHRRCSHPVNAHAEPDVVPWEGP